MLPVCQAPCSTPHSPSGHSHPWSSQFLTRWTFWPLFKLTFPAMPSSFGPRSPARNLLLLLHFGGMRAHILGFPAHIYTVKLTHMVCLYSSLLDLSILLTFTCLVPHWISSFSETPWSRRPLPCGKKEPLHVLGGNVNRFSPYGNQYADFSKS